MMDTPVIPVTIVIAVTNISNRKQLKEERQDLLWLMVPGVQPTQEGEDMVMER